SRGMLQPAQADRHREILAVAQGSAVPDLSVAICDNRDSRLASVWSLSSSNEVSTDVRDRWLPNTRFLGDINNFSSDYRTAEADSLLASTPSELAEALRDIQLLDQAVLRGQQGYEQIRHGDEETDLYR